MYVATDSPGQRFIEARAADLKIIRKARTPIVEDRLRTPIGSLVEFRTTVDASDLIIPPERPQLLLPPGPLSLLDHIPVVPWNEGLAFVTSEDGATASAPAAFTAFNSSLPQVTLGFSTAQQPFVKRCGASAVIRRDALDDGGSYLRRALDSLFRRGFLNALHKDLIEGDGTGEHLTGIANLVTPAARGTTPRLIALTNAAYSLVGRSYVGPFLVCLSPTDAALLAGDLAGTGNNIPTYSIDLLRLANIQAVIAIPGLTASRAVVGDFADAAVILERESASAAFSDSDGTQFLSGLVTAKIESRLNVGWRPEGFVLISGFGG